MPATHALAWEGIVVRVVDGDTIVVTNNGHILNVEMLCSGHAQISETYCRAVFCKEWQREAWKNNGVASEDKTPEKNIAAGQQ